VDFLFSEHQQTLRDQVRGFAERHLREEALERAHSDSYPWDVAELMAKQGLLGLTIPVSKGGLGAELMDAVLVMEQVALVCPRSADVVQAGNFGAIRTFSEYASDSLCEKYLPNLLAGRGLISVAMTEPDAGSAVTELRTTASRDGKGFLLNGSKCFTTNGPDATCFLVYCRFGPGVDGIGSVIVERGATGFTLGKSVKFLNGESWQPLHFDNVFVSEDSVLLGPGGFRKQMQGFNAERLGNTTRSLALGEYAFEAARLHAETRKQFGKTLSEFQGIQWKFAEMKINIDAGRMLLYRAATSADQGLPNATDTAIAKAFCNRVGHDCTDEAIQIMGGSGFSQDVLVEYCYRKTRAWLIAGGSYEIMLNRIAEGVFDRRFPQRAKA
jgi:alkylation response protein AidB-like acyl-CoA dehydrogenase